MINNQPSIVNTRPSPELDINTRIFCYTFLRQDEIDLAKEKKHALDFMRHNNLDQQFISPRLEVYANIDMEVRIEIHHEFICYILIASENLEFAELNELFTDLPYGWLKVFPGKLLTKISVIFQNAHDEIKLDKLTKFFGEVQLIGNSVENNAARIWTDFYDHDNDLIKILIEDVSLGPKRRGRIFQNILELENYRSLSEIAFPIAEEIIFELELQEFKLAIIVNDISQALDTKVQQKLLDQLLDLSVISEGWRSKTGHRFSATAAYQKIFEDRLVNLDETKVLGFQSFSKFLNRNTMPTFRMCEAANDRLNIFITRIDRAISLLSTRIRSSIEQQNTDLLKSVDKQNREQITLQKTIEAFAIVAISYNASALIRLLLESINAKGITIDVALYTSISIPITIAITLIAMKYLRYKNHLKQK
jgi:uncharacterized membrane-anchored protein